MAAMHILSRVIGRTKGTQLYSSRQSIFTRSIDQFRPTATVQLGTWTDKLKRWRSQGQDDTEEKKPNVSTDDSTTSDIETALKAKDEQIQDLQDKYMRALAEAENVRNRMSKQIDDSKLYGIHGFAKDLLDVADILEKANASVSKEDLNSDNKPLVSLVEGLRLTEAELQKVFKKSGVTKFDGEGDKFDPSIHEALFEVPGDNPGTVAVVSRHGYMLHGRTLRPARVGVVKAKTDS